MPFTLCLDFGNTRLKLALFNEGHLERVKILGEDPLADIEQILREFEPERSILSSVIHHDPAIEELLRTRTRFHRLNHVSRLPFTIPVGKPETMGADRIALAAAAVSLFPGSNILAIGLGSCITFNFINVSAEFLGGSISPGMEMRFKAMHHFTAGLPLVEADWNVPLVGYDTKTNMQTGVVLGMAKEIDGLIDEYSARYANFNAVLTGGDLAVFDPHLKNKIFADPDLIFKGLYAISQLNDA